MNYLMLAFFTVVAGLLLRPSCAFLGVQGKRRMMMLPTTTKNYYYYYLDLPTTTTVSFGAATTAAAAATVDGLVENFDQLCKVDDTLQALKEQLPLTLTKPLTAISASKVYSKNTRLTVVIPDEDEKRKNDENGTAEDDDDDDVYGKDDYNGGDEDDDENEITLLKSREELISLTDVLVVATTAARQANSLLDSRKNSDSKKSSLVKCQLVVDDSLQAIRVFWKASVPILGRVGSNDNNRMEGLSELVLDESSSSSGKVKTHRILRVTFNGQAVNGPAIGQSLRAIQSASANVQQSPLLQGLFSSGQPPKLFNDLRDGLLEQVATSLSSSAPPTKPPPAPLIYSVPSLKLVKMPLNTTTNVSSTTIPANLPPLPGSENWGSYTLAHLCLERFYNDVIPRLSTDGTANSNDFTSNVTLIGSDGSVLVQGKNAVSDFYQSTALARRSTGSSWTLKRCSLVDWRNRSVAIEYEAVNSLPPCTIKGRDIYSLDGSESRPIVTQIEQVELSVHSTDLQRSLDSQWLMKNLVTAVESGRLASGSGARDIFSDLLRQQLNRIGQASTTDLAPKKQKLSESAAATVYYIMSDLHERSKTLLNDTANALPPVAEYMTDDVELRGYLGETILRGRNVYARTVSSFLSNIQQSIVQKRLVVEKTTPPRVELLSNGSVRLSQIFFFRLPPPGVSIFLPESTMTGVPVKFELVSDYKINAETGRIYQHRLVETRINGQLTPGDVLSRNVQRFLNPQDRTIVSDSEDMFKTVSDTLRWFQKITESGR